MNADRGIEFIKVNAACTSFIGRLKYNKAIKTHLLSLIFNLIFICAGRSAPNALEAAFYRQKSYL
jgi:hypothetical protein